MKIPTYNSIALAAFILQIVATVHLLGTVGVGIILIVGGISAQGGVGVSAMMFGAIWILAGIGVAIFEFATAALLLAVRDIAINSFKSNAEATAKTTRAATALHNLAA